VCHVRSDPPPKHLTRVPGNKTRCAGTVEVWLMNAGETQERHRHSLAGSTGKRGIYRAPLSLAHSPKMAKISEDALHFLLAIFGDLGHLRRPIIRASPHSVAHCRFPRTFMHRLSLYS
jgi:hypothetical protein